MLNGSKRHEVAGESFYQDALSAICGGRWPDGHQRHAVATLVPEPENKHDKNAVAVHIHRRQVGHLPKAQAARLQKPLMTLRRSQGKPVGCRALIVGGWDRGRDDQGHFGVKLFFDESEVS